ncbi:MAG: T9SS type A sorting domain-containing protein [Mariprofundus sp.]|nr:T9SS type A sorting domain-containing protein [Mariprofundus sp.]
MKKTLLLLAVILTAGTLFSQTINTTYIWPDTNWTITGTYTAGNLLLNPTTTDTHFKFDDATVSNVGDVINVESPVVDLRAAFTAGEKVLKFGLTMAFTLTAASSESLGFQYWDADASNWVAMPDGSPQAGDTAGDYTTCATGPQDVYFDFNNFTTNQQQNFKYRMFYNDGGLATGKGFCLAAPTLTSVDITCSAPTALHTTSLGFEGAQIGWTANSSEVQWAAEYGTAGFNLGSGTSDNYINQNPYNISGLTDNTSYDFYVRANCIPSMAGGAVYSAWSSKFNFTTTNVPCTPPSGGLANQLKPNSVNLTWAPQGSESAWNVEYGPQGYTRGSAQTLGSFSATSSSSNTITGLTASTIYDFYVMADCGGGDTSGFAGPYTFITAAYTIGWLNLQWPSSGSINAGDSFNIYAQIYVDGITNPTGQGSNITAWIGYNTTNNDPINWPNTNWFTASYNTDVGNNDEYQLDLGAKLTTAGTYYYASRFQLNSEAFQYGGFQGGPWQMGVNNSGVLTVTGTLAVENQTIEGFSFYPNPVKDNIMLNAKQNIDQIELFNLLGQKVMFTQPGVSSYQLKLHSLTTGVYFMKVKVADKTGTYKVVKQ